MCPLRIDVLGGCSLGWKSAFDDLFMNTTLSICIATFNRAHLIGATLSSIISQAPDEVEIVIVDGGSTDNTAQVVQEYQQDFPRINYVRLDAKGGVDQDYCRAVQAARGEYCWLFSDDDLLKPGAVKTVLTAMQQNYALILVNAEARNADLSQLLSPRRFLLPTNRVYDSSRSGREKLFADLAAYLSFIGSVVIRRDLWNARDTEKYFGTEFVHLGVIFQRPLPGDTYAIAEPLIQIRHGNWQWSSRYFEVWMFKWPGIIWSFPDISDVLKSRIVAREPWRRLQGLLLFRARGVYSIGEYAKWISPRAASRWYKFVARIIAQMPGRWANLIGYLYATARGYKPLMLDLTTSPYYFRHRGEHL